MAKPAPSHWPIVLPALFALIGSLAVAIYAFDPGGIVALLAIPFSIGALVAQSESPRGETPLKGCLLYPVLAMLALGLVGWLALGEGAVCLVMALVPWTLAAIGGGLAVFINRRRAAALDKRESRLLAVGWLTLPLALALFAPPLADDWRTVSRSIVIDAPAEAVWAQLPAVDHIGADEGRWNMAQDLVGIPRPVGAALVSQHGRLVRKARWENGVRFEERITAIRPGQEMKWRFAFPDDSISKRTDRHIHPASERLTIDTGGYRLDRLADGRTRLTLWTRYRQRTGLPGYTAWWGERFLGGIQDNVLGIVADRAQASRSSAR